MSKQCEVCGGEKSKKVYPKPGQNWEPFDACPVWDEAHKKAAEDRKKRVKEYYAVDAPKGTYNAPQVARQGLNATPDVYDLLTTLVAKVNAIYDKLHQEMPSEEEF